MKERSEVGPDDSSRDRQIERAHRELHVENRMRLFAEYDLLVVTGDLKRRIDEDKLYYFMLDLLDKKLIPQDQSIPGAQTKPN